MVAVHHPPPQDQLRPAAHVARHSTVGKPGPMRIDRVVIKRDDGRGSGTPIVIAIAEPAKA